jgi:hypothetical protein
MGSFLGRLLLLGGLLVLQLFPGLSPRDFFLFLLVLLGFLGLLVLRSLLFRLLLFLRTLSPLKGRKGAVVQARV